MILKPTHLLAGATFGLLSCATHKPPPPEVAAANSAVHRAKTGPSTDLAPVQLHLAERTLEEAHTLLAKDPKSVEARDLAYIAERQAMIAETTAAGEQARLQKKEAEAMAANTKAQQQQAAEEALAATRAELERSEQELQHVFTQLSEVSQVHEDERGYVVSLSGNVFFPSGKSDLLSSGKAQLDQIAAALKGARTSNIVIEGYTDASGSASLNEALSQRRADAVLAYLAQKGLSARNLQSVGRGSARPIASNSTAEGRASNRRVEIVVQGQSTAQR